MKAKTGKKGTIAGALKSFSGFTLRMYMISGIIVAIFLGIIFTNIYSFYNVQFVTEQYQMEIRKDVQTINKRLLFAICSKDADVTAAQKEDLEKRFPKIEGYFETLSKNLNDAEFGAQLTTNWNAFSDASFEMLALVEAGDANGELEYYNSTLNDVSETLADSLDALGERAESAAASKYQTILIFIVCTLGILIIGVVSMIFVNSKKTKDLVTDIEHDLGILAKASEEIANGNVHVDIDYRADNEI